MIKLIAVQFLSLIFATSLAAETLLDGDAFDAYSRGKTLYFGIDDTAIGAEEYLPNQRVRWSLLNGQCQEGRWYQDGPLICFVYGNDDDAKCWAVYQRESGLMARLEDNPNKTTFFEVEPKGQQMVCLGPEIGV